MEFWPAAVEFRGFHREDKRRKMEMHEGKKRVVLDHGRGQRRSRSGV